jgi:hypothetical protein
MIMTPISVVGSSFAVPSKIWYHETAIRSADRPSVPGPPLHRPATSEVIQPPKKPLGCGTTRSSSTQQASIRPAWTST